MATLAELARLRTNLQSSQLAHLQHPKSVRALIAPWVGTDEVEIIRASVYRFHSLIARNWRHGRVFLAGDAVDPVDSLVLQRGYHLQDGFANKRRPAGQHRCRWRGSACGIR